MFKVEVYTGGKLPCDKCKQPPTTESPVIALIESHGHGAARQHHEIRLHNACMRQAVKLAFYKAHKAEKAEGEERDGERRVSDWPWP